MGLILTVGGKAPQIVPQARSASIPPESESDRECVAKIQAQRVTTYVRAELRAMDAMAEASARSAKVARQRGWLDANHDDPLYEERCHAHLTELIHREQAAVLAKYAIRDALRLWAELPPDRRRMVDQGDPALGVGLLPTLLKAAALDHGTDPAELMARFDGRRGVSTLCIDPMEGWET